MGKSIFKPDICLPDIQALDLCDLKARGVRCLFLDLDNTLLPWATVEAAPEMIEWLGAAQEQGFLRCIVSNGSRSRVTPLAQRLGIPIIPEAGKPFSKAFRAAMNKMDVRAEECAMIGDQILTDIAGANRAGMLTVLVDPLSENEMLLTKINRKLERLLFGTRRRRNG